MADKVTHDYLSDPVNRIVWKDARTLKGNNYNPNMVLLPEMRLLERSVLKQGWVAPLIVNVNDIVIDGFHRFRLSLDHSAIYKKYNFMVPCVVLDISDNEAKAVTIRMNRARGTHASFRMSELVKDLVNREYLDKQEVAEELGMTPSEVEILLQDNVFKARKLSEYRYSNAWIPSDNGKRGTK